MLAVGNHIQQVQMLPRWLNLLGQETSRQYEIGLAHSENTTPSCCVYKISVLASSFSAYVGDEYFQEREPLRMRSGGSEDIVFQEC
jgi:hypothetical protein